MGSRIIRYFFWLEGADSQSGAGLKAGCINLGHFIVLDEAGPGGPRSCGDFRVSKMRQMILKSLGIFCFHAHSVKPA